MIRVDLSTLLVNEMGEPKERMQWKKEERAGEETGSACFEIPFRARQRRMPKMESVRETVRRRMRDAEQNFFVVRERGSEHDRYINPAWPVPGSLIG